MHGAARLLDARLDAERGVGRSGRGSRSAAAKIAIRTRIDEDRPGPTTADRWRRTLPERVAPEARRLRRRERLAASAGSTASRAAPAGGERRRRVGHAGRGHRSRTRGSRIAVRHVDDRGSRRRRSTRDDQGEPLDHHVVAAGDRLEQRPPDARQVEHVSVSTAPDEQRAELEPDDRHDRAAARCASRGGGRRPRSRRPLARAVRT